MNSLPMYFPDILTAGFEQMGLTASSGGVSGYNQQFRIT